MFFSPLSPLDGAPHPLLALLSTEPSHNSFSLKFSASLTLLFIYLPSLHVLATLYGPRTAGGVGLGWGWMMLRKIRGSTHWIK